MRMRMAMLDSPCSCGASKSLSPFDFNYRSHSTFAVQQYVLDDLDADKTRFNLLTNNTSGIPKDLQPGVMELVQKLRMLLEDKNTLVKQVKTAGCLRHFR